MTWAASLPNSEGAAMRGFGLAQTGWFGRAATVCALTVVVGCGSPMDGKNGVSAPSTVNEVQASSGSIAESRWSTGWVESEFHLDPSTGEAIYSSDDPRFTSFEYIMEGCCDAGLAASFGSPELPESAEAADLGDGLYLASIEDWSPSDPSHATIAVRRVVGCGTPEAEKVYYCEQFDFDPKRFEALPDSTEFNVALDDNFTVQMSATLEAKPGDSYYTTYLWVGQGPAVSRLLSELADDYSRAVVEPFRKGERGEVLASTMQTDSPFRIFQLESWGSFGAWTSQAGPVLTFLVRDDGVPICLDASECVDDADPQVAPRSFESLIGATAGLHVVDGRIGFTLVGATLGG